MMFEEVMIQMGVQSNLCKQSKKLRGGWGGGSPPHDVRRRDDSNWEGLMMLRMQEAKAKNQ